MPSIRWTASLRSARVPSVTRIRTGIPCASTARCVLVLPPLLSWHILIVTFCSRCVGMHPDMAGVDHQPFIIRLINQNFQEFFPNTFSTPTDKPLMNTAPLPVIGRQVTPGRSSSQNPKYCVDKTAVILSNPAPLASLPGQMRFKQLLYFVIYTMSVIGCIHLSLSRLFRYFHFITIQTSCVDAIHANSHIHPLQHTSPYNLAADSKSDSNSFILAS